MKLLIVMMIIMRGAAHADPTAFDLVGAWKIDGYLYLTARYPNAARDLSLRYVFHFDHTATLTLDRVSSGEHCEQRFAWELRGPSIIATVTEELDANSLNCFDDPELIHQGQSAAIVLRGLGRDIALKPNDNSLPVFYIFTREGRAGDLTHD